MESVLKSQNYAPKCDFNFSLDMKLMSFKPSYTLLKSKDFNDLLKSEAEKKINLDKNLNKKKEKKEDDDSSNYSFLVLLYIQAKYFLYILKYINFELESNLVNNY